MATPTTKSTFKEYCLRKLGKPTITVNVTDEQVDDRITEALTLFYDRHFDAVEEFFLLVDITAPEAILDSNGDNVLDSNGAKTYTTGTDTEAGYIQLDDEVIAVTDIFRPQYSFGLTEIERNFYSNELYGMIRGTGSFYGGISQYYMYDAHISLINRFFQTDKQFDYNPISNKLIISGGLKATDNVYGGIIVRGFKRLYGEQQDSNTVVQNIWKNRWLQNYTTELIRENWGQNLSKYQQVQLLGGITMNGDQIMSSARERIRELEEELRNSYEYPPGPEIG